MNEDAIIAELFAPLATAAGADALADDAASFPAGQGEVVVTCDALAANVHFFEDDPAGAIAQKALRVNLSDLAAKGAEPFGYVLALALSQTVSTDWVRAFAAALAEDHTRYGVDLLGGDTLRASPGGGTTVAITAFGRTDAGKTVRRRSARPGDLLVVTGAIGDGALGLLARQDRLPAALDRSHKEALKARYLWPEPPVIAWPAVRAHASAAMDISDGLLGDCAKLCRAAGVGAVIDLPAVPLSDAVRAAIAADPGALDVAITGGDDYQILAAVRSSEVADYCRALGDVGARGTVIGEIVSGSTVALTDGGEAASVQDRRFQHF